MEMCHREGLYQIDLLNGSKNRVTDREYWAVSYTHLDVYKRQDLCSIVKDGLLALAAGKRRLYRGQGKAGVYVQAQDTGSRVGLALSLIHICFRESARRLPRRR